MLRRHPTLHYFQGYHDIVQVLLLVLGADAAIPAVERLSLLHIRDFMLPTMSSTVSHLQLLPAILYAADATLCAHLSLTQPFFALAATLTLYAHDIEEYGDIARLFDFILASEAVIPVYLFAAVGPLTVRTPQFTLTRSTQIVLSRKCELLEIEADEPEMLHSVLSKLPKPLDLEGLIQRTAEIFDSYPPEKLPGQAWKQVSANSALKTTRKARNLSKQTLLDGERYLRLQDAEIKRAEEWQKRRVIMRRLTARYKRPAAFTSAAILVGVLALMLRSDASIAPTILSFGTALRQRALAMAAAILP